MADEELMKGSLGESLIVDGAKGCKLFDTFGFINTSVKNAEDKKTLFYLKRHFIAIGWKFELFEGAEAKGQPVLTMRKGLGSPRYLLPIKLTDAAGKPVAELVSQSYIGLERSFFIDGREYLWKRTSAWFAWKLSFALVEVGGKTDAPLAEHTFGKWSHQGQVAILEAGSHLPPEIVVATALAIEALWRKYHLARTPAIGGSHGGAASAASGRF